ncbi:MAG: type II secretion system F family protein [Pseudomonadota bacterium]
MQRKLDLNKKSYFKPKQSYTMFEKGLLFFINYFFIKNIYFDLKKRLEFYRIIRTFTQNGISIQSSLRLYGAMILKYNKDTSMKFLVDDILAMMADGVRFERAIAFWVPSQESAIIEASSHDVAIACEVVTKFAENMTSIKSALVGALTYPVVMIFVLIGSLLSFSEFVLPLMVKLSPPENWPPMAQNLYALTTFIHNYLVFIAVTLIAVTVISISSLSRFTFMPIRNVLDKLPPWNIYKPYTATTFLIALASMLKTGSSFNNAVHKMGVTATPYLMHYLRKIVIRLGAGSGFGESLVIGLFEGNLLISLTVFATTNNLEKGIKFLADENLEEQRLVFIKKGRILGYMMMIAVTAVIGWVMLSLYGIQSSVQTGSVS